MQGAQWSQSHTASVRGSGTGKHGSKPGNDQTCNHRLAIRGEKEKKKELERLQIYLWQNQSGLSFQEEHNTFLCHQKPWQSSKYSSVKLSIDPIKSIMP